MAIYAAMWSDFALGIGLLCYLFGPHILKLLYFKIYISYFRAGKLQLVLEFLFVCKQTLLYKFYALLILMSRGGMRKHEEVEISD